MSVRLKKLTDQVIVITGASSGIGLATAELAVAKGARVVLCSRNKAELDRICKRLNADLDEPRAISLRCDVADVDAVQKVADLAVAKFGRIDTWINNAGVSIYARLWEAELEEKRRLFDVNFWGVVHGCRSALKAMQTSGGAIINLGSVLSDRTIPMQGMYCASKHAVKGYTDALRMEIEASGWPISISLIKPAAIDTPYPEHGLNRMEHHPVQAAPVYAPEVVAEAILACAVSPQRDVFVGGAGKLFSLMETFIPRLTDLLMEKMMMESGQSSAQLDSVRQATALTKAPRKEGSTRGNYPGHVFKSSVYTKASLHPKTTALLFAGLGFAAAAGIGYLQSQRKKPKGAGDTSLDSRAEMDATSVDALGASADEGARPDGALTH